MAFVVKLELEIDDDGVLFLPDMPAELQGRVLPATYERLAQPMNELLERQSDRHLRLRGTECMWCASIGLINLAVVRSIRADTVTISNTTRSLMMLLFGFLIVFYFLIFIFFCIEQREKEEWGNVCFLASTMQTGVSFSMKSRGRCICWNRKLFVEVKMEGFP